MVPGPGRFSNPVYALAVVDGLEGTVEGPAVVAVVVVTVTGLPVARRAAWAAFS